MFSSSSRKPYTAVTVLVERLTSPEYEQDDWSGIPDLVEAIRIQDSGPTEAARALRKKLKYGNSHRQIRALVIIDGLIQNGGGRFQRTFADEPLLERLRILPRDDMVDSEVRAKCNTLFRQWAVNYKNTPGLGGIAVLHKQLPTKQRPTASQSKVIRETERDVENENPFESESPPRNTQRRQSSIASPVSPSSPSSGRPRAKSTTPIGLGPSANLSVQSTKKDKKKGEKFHLEKEKPVMMQTIASASVASTNLLNGLKLINREHTQPSQDRECVNRFETCKTLRRQILRYIQLVESDQWIGSLLSANDELVKALLAFEIMDKSVDDDSDSETEDLPVETSNGAATSHSRKTSLAAPPNPSVSGIANLRIKEDNEEELPPSKPPRPRGSSQQAGASGSPQVHTPHGGIPTPLTAAVNPLLMHKKRPSIPSGPAPPVPASAFHGTRAQTQAQTQQRVAKDDEEADDDPFGDQNAIS